MRNRTETMRIVSTSSACLEWVPDRRKRFLCSHATRAASRLLPGANAGRCRTRHISWLGCSIGKERTDNVKFRTSSDSSRSSVNYGTGYMMLA